MNTPRIPLIPIPPSTEVKVLPRPLLARVFDGARESEADEPLEGQTAEPVDRVEFSVAGRSYTSARQLVKEVLAKLSQDARDAVGSQRIAGQEEFQARFEAQTDFSPQGTADLILQGVTGYIYGAFRMSRSELSEADLEQFHEEAVQGIRRGYQEAKAYLTGRELFQDDVAEDARSTVDKVLDGLDRFVAEERERLFGAGAVDSESPE